MNTNRTVGILLLAAAFFAVAASGISLGFIGWIGGFVLLAIALANHFRRETHEAVQTVEMTFVQGRGGGTITSWIDANQVLDRFVADPATSTLNKTVGWNEFTS